MKYPILVLFSASLIAGCTAQSDRHFPDAAPETERRQGSESAASDRSFNSITASFDAFNRHVDSLLRKGFTLEQEYRSAVLEHSSDSSQSMKPRIIGEISEVLEALNNSRNLVDSLYRKLDELKYNVAGIKPDQQGTKPGPDTEK